jgi:hypothetical protein
MPTNDTDELFHLIAGDDNYINFQELISYCAYLKIEIKSQVNLSALNSMKNILPSNDVDGTFKKFISKLPCHDTFVESKLRKKY